MNHLNNNIIKISTLLIIDTSASKNNVLTFSVKQTAFVIL